VNSDKQIKVAGGSALSYHAFVEKLVKKFTRAASILHTNSTTNIGYEDKTSVLAEEFDRMATKLEYMHLAIGLATEGAEAADVIKQHAIYGKEFDRAALVKELGDLRFWIQDAQNKFHISDHEIAQGNADKLSERYKNVVYSDEQAIKRVDKKYELYEIPEEDTQWVKVKVVEHEYEANDWVCEDPSVRRWQLEDASQS